MSLIDYWFFLIRITSSHSRNWCSSAFFLQNGGSSWSNVSAFRLLETEQISVCLALVSSLESSLYYYFCKAEPATLLMMSHYLMIFWVLCWPCECYPLFTALKQYLSLSLKHKGLLIVLPGTWLETTTCACHKGWKGFIPDPQKRLVIRKKRNTCLCNYAHLTFRKKLRFNKHNFCFHRMFFIKL